MVGLTKVKKKRSMEGLWTQPGVLVFIKLILLPLLIFRSLVSTCFAFRSWSNLMGGNMNHVHFLKRSPCRIIKMSHFHISISLWKWKVVFIPFFLHTLKGKVMKFHSKIMTWGPKLSFQNTTLMMYNPISYNQNLLPLRNIHTTLWHSKLI